MSASSIPFEYKVRYSAGAAEIVARDDLWKTFRKNAGAKGLYGAEAVMELYVEHGPEGLPPTKFVFEEHFSAAGRKVRIEAFKGFQTRLYGFAAQVNGKRTFFITGLDLSKKADKAKRRLLDVAGKEAIKVLKALG